MQTIPEQVPFGSVSWVFPGIMPPNAQPGTKTMTGVIANRPQQTQFGDLSKLAVPHNWPVVKIINVNFKMSILYFNILIISTGIKQNFSTNN